MYIMKKTFMRTGLAFVILVILQPGARSQVKSSAGQPESAVTTTLFDYDRKTDYQVHTDSVFYRDHVEIRDISFVSCNPVHGRIKAYVVIPEGKPPYAGIIFFHWLGTPDGNRNEFLDEAVEFAGHSTLSVLIQGYFPWIESPVAGDADRQQVIDQTTDLRRAMDIMFAQPGVDPARTAFVGHDYGAMFGSIMAGVDKRVKACVLVAGMGNFGDWSLKYWKKTAGAGAETYRKALEPVDPIQFISHASPTSLFFQFAGQDIYISKNMAMEFFTAASESKSAKWYDTGHEMNTPEVKHDRMEWIKLQLDIH
jgi:dienelactone hydrolase